MIEENEGSLDPELVRHEKLKARVLLEEEGYILKTLKCVYSFLFERLVR